jgi:predicted metal-dependent hydrolase
MHAQVQLGDIGVDVVRKDIKNVHLSVHPPTSRVTISSPLHLSLDAIRVFALSKLGWIRQQQKKLLEQERESPREYLNRESHYIWGQRYLLKVIVGDCPPSVELSHRQLVFRVRPDWHQTKKQELLEAWYREQLKVAVLPLIAKWEPLIGVKVSQIWFIRHKNARGLKRSGHADSLWSYINNLQERKQHVHELTLPCVCGAGL